MGKFSHKTAKKASRTLDRQNRFKAIKLAISEFKDEHIFMAQHNRRYVIFRNDDGRMIRFYWETGKLWLGSQEQIKKAKADKDGNNPLIKTLKLHKEVKDTLKAVLEFIKTPVVVEDSEEISVDNPVEVKPKVTSSRPRTRRPVTA